MSLKNTVNLSETQNSFIDENALENMDPSLGFFIIFSRWI